MVIKDAYPPYILSKTRFDGVYFVDFLFSDNTHSLTARGTVGQLKRFLVDVEQKRHFDPNDPDACWNKEDALKYVAQKLKAAAKNAT